MYYVNVYVIKLKCSSSWWNMIEELEIEFIWPLKIIEMLKTFGIYLFITLRVGSLSLFNFVKILSLDLNSKFLWLFCSVKFFLLDFWIGITSIVLLIDFIISPKVLKFLFMITCVWRVNCFQTFTVRFNFLYSFFTI